LLESIIRLGELDFQAEGWKPDSQRDHQDIWLAVVGSSLVGEADPRAVVYLSRSARVSEESPDPSRHSLLISESLQPDALETGDLMAWWRTRKRRVQNRRD
jgi:hypothetical protein